MVTVPEEALYPVDRRDSEGRALHGSHGYRTRIPRGAEPPVDAFSIEIAVGSTPSPEADRINWLPAPEAAFYLMLRLYIPRPEALDGSWRPPAVRRVAPAS